ncbi:GL11525 [Drosophila persimilis]|uniref:GL11525 n=1 Tax=Drosophila persimilis TaxID=7234 RepID=B4GBC4_DROPE|nr:GL11525 [Drosophila persimilis]
MEVLCKILAVCSLLVSAQAFVAVEPASSSELSWKSLFFDALVGNSNELQAAGALSSLEECTAIYTVENIEILLTASYKIRRCIRVDEKDIRRYLKQDDATHTRKSFERELLSCSRRDCYVDSILNLFSSVRLSRHDYRRSRHCILKEVEQALIQLDRASIVLANCLAEQQPSQNSTLPPPIWNTTHTTPNWNWNNTTSGPSGNTTEWPWWSNTTAGPNVNTTQGPWWGNTTSGPSGNTTEWPWWSNTTAGSNVNTTHGPWWGNTTSRSKPQWNRTTTDRPQWNRTTTDRPQSNRTTTDRPQLNETTTEAPATTEGNWWDQLFTTLDPSSRRPHRASSQSPVW